MERHCDVAVIGGSAAGLAAALQLLRQRRTVIVVDSGEPRNAPAAHMHSFLGREGEPPADLVNAGRAEVRSYGGEVLAGRALSVTRTDDGRFRVEFAAGHTVLARRVLAATGLVDELPEIEGLAEHWGREVIHCPFCHGYETRDRRIVQIVTHPLGLHPAALFRQLSSDFTIVLHGGVDADAAELGALRAAGVPVLPGPVRRIVAGDDGHLAAVELDNGERLPADTVAIATRFRARAEPFAPLGLRPTAHPTGFGDYIETDAQGATAIDGVYAAGNLTDPSQQVLPAAASGSWVGAMISFGLAQQDLAAAARPSADEAEWDQRYGGEQIWSGNPNGALVREAEELAPGRALDVGAGEGGDAVWLAEHGWSVTASDISQRALDRIAETAGRCGRRIDCLRADANALDPFGSGTFDLVSASYASIKRSPDDRGLRNLLNAVAPGGTLLVIGHDLDPAHAPIDRHEHGPAFDPDAYLRVDDFVAALAQLPDWEIHRHERRPRPAGAATAAVHSHDIVLRAHRRSS